MSKELTIPDHQIREINGYSLDEIDTIKSVMGFNMSDVDLRVFLHVCRHTKLDPMCRQIFAIPRGGKMTIQTSIDGFRLIADRTGCYAPGRPTEFHYSADGFLVSATAYVKKFAGGMWHEIGEQANFAEYNGHNNFWKKMPTVMIAKVAEARALRRAFPADLSGIYTEDEMDQSKIAPRMEMEIPTEPSISQDEWEKLDAYLNGYEDLRKSLKKLCKVDDLRNIKPSQKEAVKGYAKAYMRKQKDTKENA